MVAFSEFIVLAIFVTYSAARSMQLKEPVTPPEIQDDDPFYPTALANKIISSLTEEQLKLFNKNFVDYRDSEGESCPSRHYEGTPSEARAEDGIVYYLLRNDSLKQNFILKICQNKTSPKCKPHLSSSIAECRQEPKLQKALIIPTPARLFKNVGGKSYVGDTEITAVTGFETLVYVEKSECTCKCTPKESN